MEPETVLNRPAGQGEQDVAPVVAENVPGAQAMQDVAPETELANPAGHGEQDVAPEMAENVPGVQAVQNAAPEKAFAVPAGHGVHDVAPVMLLNVPGTHGVHGADPVELKNPGAHSCAKDVDTWPHNPSTRHDSEISNFERITVEPPRERRRLYRDRPRTAWWKTLSRSRRFARFSLARVASSDNV